MRAIHPDSNPFEIFQAWTNEAKISGDYLDGAMALATASLKLAPSLRMVLLKEFSPEGFIFFTNYEGRKGQELLKNPQAALLFYWPKLNRQVRVEGTVEKISRSESKSYFATRGRSSQLGAWASQQSREIAGREELQKKVEAFDEKFKDTLIPCPPYWGGFRVSPKSIEFWVNGAGRLHDRLFFSKGEKGWKLKRLSP